MGPWKAIGFGAWLVSTAAPVPASPWELSAGAKGQVETVEGREVVSLENGVAYRRDLRLEDGTIELEVQVTRQRSFVYLMFRMEGDRDYEEIYLRPHKSGLPDAVQYAPVYQGQSAWQLYHGPGGTAAVEFEPGVWVPMRVVVKGRRAAVFLGDEARPVLVVDRLSRDPRAGTLAVRAFRPRGAPERGPIARFAGLRVRPEVDASVFAAPPPEPTSIPGVVPRWAVSGPLPALEASGLPVLPSAGPLQVVAADARGLVELHRHVRLPEKPQDGTVVAGFTVRATTAGIRAFDLGFSDQATVFLNGRPLFSCDASFRTDAPRREGLIGFDQSRLYLPLAEGDNEVRVVVSDGFGGWGIMARFVDPAGLDIAPR